MFSHLVWGCFIMSGASSCLMPFAFEALWFANFIWKVLENKFTYPTLFLLLFVQHIFTATTGNTRTDLEVRNYNFTYWIIKSYIMAVFWCGVMFYWWWNLFLFWLTAESIIITPLIYCHVRNSCRTSSVYFRNVMCSNKNVWLIKIFKKWPFVSIHKILGIWGNRYLKLLGF